MFKYLLKNGISNNAMVSFVQFFLKIKKLLSIIIVISILLNSVFNNLIIFAKTNDNSLLDSKEDVPYSTLNDQDFDPSNVGIDFELDDARTLNSKTFKKLDGTYEVVMYDCNVHYKEKDKLKDIDNSLIHNVKENIYMNKQNGVEIQFPNKINSDKNFSIKNEMYKIEWNIINGQEAKIEQIKDINTKNNDKRVLKNITSEVLYKNVHSGIDIEYIIAGTTIKENIILNYYMPDSKITFEYDIENLSLLMNENNNISFVNAESEQIFYFADLLMFDAKQNTSSDIEMEVVPVQDNKFIITIIPKQDWLKNATYPVIIDPTIVTSDSSYFDTYVNMNTPLINHNVENVMVMSSETGLISKGLISFNLPSLSNKNLTYAHLYLKTQDVANQQLLYLYKNTQCYSSSSVTWNTKPTHETSPIEYAGNSNDTYSFDITSAIYDWIEDGLGGQLVPGFSLLNSSIDENITLYTKEKISTSLKPSLRIGYIDVSGIKDYWTYQTQSAGFAGQSLVSDFTGLLNIVRNEYAFTTSKQTLDLSFIYNSTNHLLNIGYGYGWKTNYHIKLCEDSVLNTFYVEDATGNRVYYSLYDTTSIDNVEYNLFIAEDGSGNILYDSPQYQYVRVNDNISYVFDNEGRLQKIMDSSLPFDPYDEMAMTLIKIFYVSSTNRISHIIDRSNNQIDFTYTNGQLIMSSLSSYQTSTVKTMIQKVEYSYVDYYSNFALASATYYKKTNDVWSADDTAYYIYDDANNDLILTEAYDSNGLKIKFEYNSSSNWMNNAISSIAAEINSCQIDRWTYEYAFKKTKITDVQGNYIFYSFDDYGHTVNIIDNDGTVKFYRYLNLFKKYICETEAEERIYTFIDGTPNYYNNHKLIEESTPQHNKFNPITNHGFENSQSLVGWSTGFEPGSSAIICTSSNPVNTGETSAKIQLSSGNGVFLYQEIMLDVGYYTLSANIFHTDYNDEAYIDITGEASNVPIIPIYGKDEWQKTSISFRVETNNTPIIIKLVSHTTYAVYFDDIQINSGYKDNRINYMENPSVESVNLDSSVPGWVFSNMSVQRYLLGDDNDISEEDILGDYAIRIDGSPVQKRYAIGELGRYIRLDNFSLQVGCWAKTEGTRTTNTTNLIYERMFRLRIREASIVDPQMNYVDHYIDFDSSIEGWQYYSKTIQLEIDGTKTIQIFAEYQGLGNVYFDGFHVYESPTITRYIYNEEGNISLILLPNGDTTEYEYDDNDKNKLIKITNIINEVVYENIPVYDERGNIIESINNNIRIAVNSVDEYGNALSIVVGDQYTNYTHTTEYLNTSFGQYKSKDIDEYNNETNYYYNIYSGLLIAIENAKEIDTHYIYDDEGKLINVICLDDYTEYDSQYQDYYSKTSYQYDQNDRLTNIIMKDGYSYQLIYDNLGRISSVKVNDNEIVAYGYEIYQVEIDNQIETFYSDKISSKSYANEDVFVFEYNENDILEAVNFQKLGGAFKTKFSYEYDHMDRVYCLSIYNNDIIVKNEYYGYDGLGRLISIADDCDNSINYQYDENNNLIGLEFNIEDRVHATEYNYNKYLSFDNSNYNTTSNNYDYTNYTTITNDAVVKEYSYEGNALYRLSEVNILLNNTYLIKQNVEYSSKKTRITKISYDINDYEINFDYRYEYDELGNITKLSYYEDDTLSYCHDYVYDELNQLEFEDIYHVSTSYAKMIQYDKHGNIQSIKTIPYQSRQAIQPPSFICDNRGIPAIMIYNAGKTYTDIYTLNIGQTPSLSFHYVDPVEEDLITGAVTSLSGSNLNVNQAGYYYQDYCAHSNSGLNIFFRIVFQVGNPIQPERVYHYDQTWLDKLISYDIIEEGDSLTKQITYDNIGNPICITHFKYNGVIYDNALLDWEGRQLTRIDIIDDEEVITSIHYRYNDQGYRISKSITNYTYAIQEEDVYNSGIIQGTTIVPNTQNVFNNYNEITVYINGFGYHTFTSYGDLYIEDYDYLGDLYIEVYPSGIYIYAPYAVWKVTGFYTATTSSTSTINYTLSNGLVIYETDGTYDIIYTYDYDGTLISFHYDENINDAINGEEYFYIKNLQGDITTIVNSQGIIQVGYRYDGWGNILSIITPSGSSFNPFINPYTYRGYRYDVETSLYYCNSRYYNPEWGRWLNADDVGYLDPSSVNGLNLYAYCNNNPIMYSDPSGCFWDYILDAGCIIAGLIDFIKEPTWGKAGWLVLDIGLAILPFVPAISSARHLNKANNLIDLASTMNKLDNYGDVVVQSAKITDFTDDAWDIIQGLDRANGYTKSTMRSGNLIHDGFHVFSQGKEFVTAFGRMDDVNDALKIIYELKPNNLRSIKQGIKQLNRYNKYYDGLYRMVLIVY